MRNLTWEDVFVGSGKGYGKGRAPSIKKLAAFINENMLEFRANVSATSHTPYMKYEGSRIRHDFKRRDGYRLEVYAKIESSPNGIVRPVFTHSTVETYRRNSEVCEWIWAHRVFIHAAQPAPEKGDL